jgi:hypothetical protein
VKIGIISINVGVRDAERMAASALRADDELGEQHARARA